MEIFERIRYARDQALDAERTERERLAEAGNADLQQAASVRLATRQAVREALAEVAETAVGPAGHGRSDWPAIGVLIVSST